MMDDGKSYGVTGPTLVVSVSLPSRLYRAVDLYRRTLDVPPSRPKAIRLLIEQALNSGTRIR
jgi:hypothetical protein